MNPDEVVPHVMQGVTELPNLIALNVLAGKISHRLILILGAGLAYIGQQLEDRVHRYASNSHGRPKVAAFDQAP